MPGIGKVLKIVAIITTFNTTTIITITTTIIQ